MYESHPVLGPIERGGRERKLVAIEYTNRKAETKLYVTEPYEIKGGFYWGFDVDEGSIKKFFINNIHNAQVTTGVYSPRWPVKF